MRRPPIRLVLLTGSGIEHRYVAGVIAEAFPDELVAILDAASMPFRARLRAGLRRYSTSQMVSVATAKAYRVWRGCTRRRAATLAHVLFPRGVPPTLPRPELVRVVPSHNHGDCLALLEALQPDVIAVYGTGIIRPPVMRLARRAILNMHTGLSPRYRGSDTVFWALHNEEPEWIGDTIHVLTEAVDGGDILRTARPAIDANDDEDSLFAKCVLVGGRCYVDCIRDVAAERALPRPQPSGDGREYRFVDRTIAAERRVERLLRAGLLRNYVGHRV